MKKKNTGHELDFIADQYESIKGIVIYGMGELGNEIRNVLTRMHFQEFYSLTYVDKNYKKMENVNSPEWILRIKNKNVLVVLAIAETETRERITTILQKIGFLKKNICDYTDFYNVILPVLSVYYLDKIYLDSLQISVGDKCNLRCKDCTNFIPYMKKLENRPLQTIISDIDLLFKKIDYIRHFPIIGGETLLYSELPEFIYYLLEKYCNQIGELWIYSNGSLPSKMNQSFLAMLKKYNEKIHFFVSNYTHKNPRLKDKFTEFIEILETEKVQYVYIENFTWNDTGIARREIKKHINIEDFVSLCSQPCRDYEDGKIYYCAVAKYSGKAFGIRDNKNEIDINESNKKEIVEFVLGYIESGYLEMCKYCNGYDQFTNDKIIESGIQI